MNYQHHECEKESGMKKSIISDLSLTLEWVVINIIYIK